MEKIQTTNGDFVSGYKLPGFLFKKYWFWFEEPRDIVGADMANFFSYNKTDKDGFVRKSRMTTVIDLGQSLEAIWGKMREKFVRKQVERGERNGIVVKQDNNFKDFKKIYFAFRKGKNIPKDNYKVFEKNGIEFSAYLDGRMIAGGIFIANDDCARAWVLASLRLDNADGRTRDIIGQANRMVIWEAIKYFKASGRKIFDLGGISPDSSKKDELSLTEFKEAFGGDRKMSFFYYKVYSPVLKFLMRLRKQKT